MADSAQFVDLQVYQRLSAMQADIEALKARTPTGGSGGMSNDTNDLVDHKIALSELRAETKVIRLEGKIDLLAQSISTLGTKIDTQRTEATSSRNIIVGTIIAASLSVAALIYAIVTYGASAFYNGTVVRDIVHSEISSSTRPANGPSTGATPGH